MTHHNPPPDPFDTNLKRMLESAMDPPRPAFQDRLVRDVLAEVAKQRRLESTPRRWWGWRFVVPTAAAAGLVIAVITWMNAPPTHPRMGQVSPLYGIVTVQDNGTPQTIADMAELRSGQRIQTQSGSKARVLFDDQSQITPDPRTRLRVDQTRQGPRILLESGMIHLQAAPQPLDQFIAIETAHAQVKVLGTKLDVRLVRKPNGVEQTQVRVLEGKVDLTSGGHTVRLGPGMEGIADANQPPTRQSLVFEVNELIRLLEQTRAREKQSGRPQGLPMIVDFTTATLWSVIPGTNLSQTAPGEYSLTLKFPAFQARAYTMEGAEVPASGSGNVLRLDARFWRTDRHRAPPELLLMKVSGVGGLVQILEGDICEYQCPGNGAEIPSLVQFHLPTAAQIKSVNVPILSTNRQRDRLIITVAASARMPAICNHVQPMKHRQSYAKSRDLARERNVNEVPRHAGWMARLPTAR